MAHTDLSRLNASELTNPRRVAVLAVHTSPLAQPGVGDAGGMNVYVLQSALHLARRGIEVEIFTRATASTDPPVVQVAPGVLVRNVVAGPFEGLDKYDLPTQLCAFAAGAHLRGRRRDTRLTCDSSRSCKMAEWPTLTCPGWTPQS